MGERLARQVRIEVDQLNKRHFGAIPMPGAQFEDSGIAAWPIHNRRGDSAIQFFDGFLILEVREKQAPIGLRIYLSPGEQRFNVTTQSFGFSQRSDDTLVLYQRKG
jgi:hypothetical protein